MDAADRAGDCSTLYEDARTLDLALPQRMDGGALPHGEFDGDSGLLYSAHMHGKRKRPGGDACLGLEGVLDGSAVLSSWHAAAHRHHAQRSVPDVGPLAKGPIEPELRCDMLERESGAVGNVLNSWHLAAQRYVTHLGTPAKGPDEFELSSGDLNTELALGPSNSGRGMGGVSDLHEATACNIKGEEPAAQEAHEACQQIIGVGRPSLAMQRQGSHQASHQVLHIHALCT